MRPLWLLDFAWPSTGSNPSRLPPGIEGEGTTLWRSADGLLGRAYRHSDAGSGPGARPHADAGSSALAGAGASGTTWTALECLREIEGPGHGERAVCHYVVEADVAPEHDADFNAWYEEEHLPGLAGVPGTIRATRFRRLSGAPRYLACYDLMSPTGLERPEWLAVRHTPWSARIRPLFLNTRRTMFFRPDESSRR